jgi:hypothetical protein
MSMAVSLKWTATAPVFENYVQLKFRAAAHPLGRVVVSRLMTSAHSCDLRIGVAMQGSAATPAPPEVLSATSLSPHQPVSQGGTAP